MAPPGPDARFLFLSTRAGPLVARREGVTVSALIRRGFVYLALCHEGKTKPLAFGPAVRCGRTYPYQCQCHIFRQKSSLICWLLEAQHAGLFAVGLLVYAIGVAVRAAKARGLLEIAEFIT